MKHSSLLAATVVLTATAGIAQSGAPELPVTAGRCAIYLALTGHADAGCSIPENGAFGPARSLPPKGYSTAAAPLDSSPQEHGYFIRFPFNSSELTREYRDHLQRLAEVAASPGLENSCIKLVGHTDSVGSSRFNMRLSSARARRVAAFLATEGGIGMERIVTAARGDSDLLPQVPGPHPLNRRVEILARHKDGAACN